MLMASTGAASGATESGSWVVDRGAPHWNRWNCTAGAESVFVRRCAAPPVIPRPLLFLSANMSSLLDPLPKSDAVKAKTPEHVAQDGRSAFVVELLRTG